jgi:hypothetical protein
MSVFDTSVTTTATLPTWFSDAQKNIATSGKTVYDTATPFSNTATASMSKNLFGTPSQQTYGMTAPNTGGMDWEGGYMDNLGGYNGGVTPQGSAPITGSDVDAFGEPYAGRGSLANDVPNTDINGNLIGGPVTGGGISDPYMPRPTDGGLPTSSNPFTTAMQTLQGVASGAANPFMANGQPNTQTALGGLFAAQNAKLNQILPEIAARTGAGGIAGGNAGSLRGQTAVNTARAGALTTLAEQQNRAALDAQNQAIAAAKGVGDVGTQYSTSAINTGKEEMNAGLNQLAKYSDIVNAMGPTMDKTTNTVTKGSQYENLLKGLTAAGQAGVSIDKILKGNTGLGWLDKIMTGGVGNITADPSLGTAEGAVQDGTYTDPNTGETYYVGGA